MEGLAFGHRLGIEGLETSSDSAIGDHAMLSRGSHRRLNSILADLFGVPVAEARSSDPPNLGAGMLAAVAARWCESIDVASAAMTGVTDLLLQQRVAPFTG